MRNTSPRQLKNKSALSPKPLSKSPQKGLRSSQKSAKSLSQLKKSPSKQPNHQQILIKMRKNRQRLCNTLDTYTLLIRSNHPIRCLQHNSNISIYCQTEQKLLCSNCIFSKLDHKYHKVVPVDKVHSKLARDIEIMQRQIQREVEGIQDVYSKIFQHHQEEQKTAQQTIIKLKGLYQDARIMIDECELQAKRTVIRQIQKVQIKHQTVLAQLNFLKNVYKDQYAQVPPANDSNFLLYEHLMCNTVVAQGKFSHTKWKNPNKQIKKVQIDQCRQIINILDLLDNYLKEKLKTNEQS